MENNSDELSARVVQIQAEARRLYGRTVSSERAQELLAEVVRYEQAISALDQGRGFEEEPRSFFEALVRLAAVPSARSGR